MSLLKVPFGATTRRAGPPKSPNLLMLVAPMPLPGTAEPPPRLLLLLPTEVRLLAVLESVLQRLLSPVLRLPAPLSAPLSAPLVPIDPRESVELTMLAELDVIPELDELALEGSAGAGTAAAAASAGSTWWSTWWPPSLPTSAVRSQPVCWMRAGPLEAEHAAAVPSTASVADDMVSGAGEARSAGVGGAI